MEETTQKIIQMVERLNGEYWEASEDDELVPFSFGSTGNIDFIEFMNLCIWNTDNDDREYIYEQDTYEPLEPYIRKIANSIIEQLNKCKF